MKMKKARILIVEDEAIVSEDLEIAIDDIGYEVVGSVVSTDDAIKKAIDLKPDLILMDIILKGKKNGIDASYEIKEKLDIPVIFLTAFSDIELIEKAKDTEPYAYIIKPFQERELLASIEIALFKSQMEKNLKESEMKYRTLVENIQDGVFLIQDGKFKFVNKAFANIPGYTVDEVIGMDFRELIAPEDLDMVSERYVKMMAGEDVPLEYEFHGIGNSTNTQSTIHMVTSLIEYHGKPAALGTVKDISVQKKAEEALQKSEQRLDFAVTGANLGLWDWNVQTGEAIYNRQWAEMLGYSIEEIEPKTNAWKNFIHTDDAPEVMKILNAHLQGKIPIYEAEFRMRSRFGEWKWILSTGKVFEWDENGNPVRMTGLHRDLTRYKQAEKQIQQIN